MKLQLKNRGLSTAEIVLTAVFFFFSLLSAIYVGLTSNALFSYFYCLASAAFVLMPPGLTILFRWKFHFSFYLFFSIYTLGPLLGAVYNVYYYTSWWDDLLHFMAGAVFAAIGAQLAIVLNKNQKPSYLLTALFGLLFSMGIAVVWEIYEFSSDMLLHSDMQADTVIDTVITKINSNDGSVRVFEGIEETIVNGQSMGITGYLDIGLIDTMTDMIVETAGALFYLAYAVIDKDRHPMVRSI